MNSITIEKRADLFSAHPKNVKAAIWFFEELQKAHQELSNKYPEIKEKRFYTHPTNQARIEYLRKLC